MYCDATKNQIFLIYHLLRSIRLDFSEDSALKERRDLALKLCGLAAKEYEARAKYLKKHPEEIPYWGTREENLDRVKKLRILEETISGFLVNETDGRYFRYDFPEGYEGMLEYFGMKEEEK